MHTSLTDDNLLRFVYNRAGGQAGFVEFATLKAENAKPALPSIRYWGRSPNFTSGRGGMRRHAIIPYRKPA